jgi:hypothetical protein
MPWSSWLPGLTSCGLSAPRIFQFPNIFALDFMISLSYNLNDAYDSCSVSASPEAIGEELCGAVEGLR